MITHDSLRRLGDLWQCDGCKKVMCVLPGGAAPFPPFHLINHPESGLLVSCGTFHYAGQCPHCRTGTCANQKEPT